MTLRRTGTALCCLTVLAACHSAPSDTTSQPERAAEDTSSTQAALSSGSSLIPYGPDGFAVRKPGFEQVAEGPSAVALDAQGQVLVLDRLAGRVVRVDDAGRLSTVASVAVDTMDLATATDGSFVAFSPVRATAWLFQSNGAAIGEVKVPREVHDLLHVEVGPSRMITLRTSYQESIDVGSPSAPLPLSVALATKREGSVQLADGRGLAVRVQNNQAELLVMHQANGDERAAVDQRYPLAGDSSAARIVGLDGNVACLRVEHVTSTPAISVDRELVCMDALSGAVVLHKNLPAPGLYLPPRELAVGHGRVAMIHPEKDGVSVQRWSLRSAGKEVTR